MSFGRSGMTQTEQWVILERDVMQFDPDLVIIVFLPINDIDEVSPATADELLRPFFHVTDTGALELDTGFTRQRPYFLKRMVNPFKQHSALVSLGVERYTLLRRSRRRAER